MNLSGSSKRGGGHIFESWNMSTSHAVNLAQLMHACSVLQCLFCHELAYANDVWLHLLVPPLAQCCYFGASCLTLRIQSANIYAINSKVKWAFLVNPCLLSSTKCIDHTFPLTSPTGKAERGGASLWSIVNYEKAVKWKTFSWTQGTSSFQVLHEAGVLASNNLEMALVCQSCT